jgi:hypothetical protein
VGLILDFISCLSNLIVKLVFDLLQIDLSIGHEVIDLLLLLLEGQKHHPKHFCVLSLLDLVSFLLLVLGHIGMSLNLLSVHGFHVLLGCKNLLFDVVHFLGNHLETALDGAIDFIELCLQVILKNLLSFCLLCSLLLSQCLKVHRPERVVKLLSTLLPSWTNGLPH